ncbi:MAG: MMPL family transporter, partial [Planctomycetales bacterium]|nr:MMPL family transporter [Planctomycetales bacterium]
MSQLFNRATLWMVDRPKLVWGLLGTISIIAIVGYWNPRFLVEAWDANEGRSSSANSANTTQSPTAPDVDPFSLDADAVLVVQSDAFFSPAGATALRDIVSELEAADYVRNVLWMDRVPIMNIFGLPEPLFPRSEASAERFANAQEKALGNPLVKGQLLSADAKTLLMMVQFDYLFIESDQACVAGLREIFERTAARHPEVELSLEITGRVPIYLDIMKTRDENVVRYQLIGYGMVLLMSVILFRGIWAVIVVAIAPSLGVFWTLGILRFLELQDNPFNDVVLPVLLSMVGLTDGVHLMVQIRRFRAEGMSPKEAAREGIRHVGLACFLTSLTTAIGFGSLLLADHEIVEEFGLSCTIGVLLTFVAV